MLDGFLFVQNVLNADIWFSIVRSIHETLPHAAQASLSALVVRIIVAAAKKSICRQTEVFQNVSVFLRTHGVDNVIVRCSLSAIRDR